MNQKIVLIIVALCLISSCGENAVDIVKQSSFPLDSSYTNSQAFDNRPVCTKVAWESFEDSRGREIVEYTCVIKNSDIFYKNKTSKVINRTKRQYETYISRIDEEINSNSKARESEREIKFHEKAIVDLKNNQDISSIEWRYRGALSQLQNILTHISINKEDKDKEYYKSLINRETNEAIIFLEKEKEKFKVSLTKEKKELEDLKKTRNNKVEKLNEEKKSKINHITQRKILYAHETIQWSIGQNGIPSVTYTGLSLATANKIIEKPSDINKVLKISVNDNIYNYQNYISGIDMWLVAMDEFYERHLKSSN
jgi:hypothetical protein